MSDAWNNLAGTTGDAYERMCGTSGDAYNRLAGTSGDAWTRLIVTCGEIVDWFKEVFSQVSKVTLTRIQESKLWK